MNPRFALALAALLGFVFLSSAGPNVVREGTGERRTLLDKMELTDFDRSLWSELTGWTNGGPVDASSTDGKVVLIYTWASWLPTATRPMSVVNRLAERYGEDGLMVVGVHHDEGWEDAASVAERRRVTFPIAHDEGNKLREALMVDQDPDFHLIDRAGRLRYADIETASLERAVKTLIEEETRDAENLLDRMAAEEARAAETARRSQRLRSRIDLKTLPWVSFPQPGEDAYSAAAWPKPKEDEDDRRRSRRRDSSGPVKINLNPELEWVPHPPEHTAGRATLIYLFTEEVMTEFSRGGHNAVELFQQMDRLQAAHARDLLVVGVMIPEGQDDRRRRRRDDDSGEDRNQKAAEAFEKVTEQIPVNHYRVNAFASQSVITSRIDPNNASADGRRRSSRRGAFLLPYHVLASSDGMVRWHGSIGPTAERSAEWQAALDTVLRVDPGIQARREAEERYIRSQND